MSTHGSPHKCEILPSPLKSGRREIGRDKQLKSESTRHRAWASAGQWAVVNRMNGNRWTRNNSRFIFNSNGKSRLMGHRFGFWSVRCSFSPLWRGEHWPGFMMCSRFLYSLISFSLSLHSLCVLMVRISFLFRSLFDFIFVFCVFMYIVHFLFDCLSMAVQWALPLLFTVNHQKKTKFIQQKYSHSQYINIYLLYMNDFERELSTRGGIWYLRKCVSITFIYSQFIFIFVHSSKNAYIVCAAVRIRYGNE